MTAAGHVRVQLNSEVHYCPVEYHDAAGFHFYNQLAMEWLSVVEEMILKGESLFRYSYSSPFAKNNDCSIFLTVPLDTHAPPSSPSVNVSCHKLNAV